MQDRTNLTPELLQRMRRELVELLSKYVEMDKDALELNFDQEGDQMALMLSIPVIRAKDEEEIEKALAKEDAKEEDEDEASDEEIGEREEANEAEDDEETSEENDETEEDNSEEVTEEEPEIVEAEEEEKPKKQEIEE